MRLGSWLRTEISPRPAPTSPVPEKVEEPPWDQVCFCSSPIREPDSEQRRHSNAFLELLIEPALEGVDGGLEVIRADELPSSPITAEVYKHVVCARLMIADLSYHNPNVLEEIGIRIAISKPLVLISRNEDPIPSNLREERVILVNTSQFWQFQAEIDERREEIARFSQWALSPQARDASPLRRLFPGYRRFLE